MGHVIGRGRYAREVYPLPARPGGSSSFIGASIVFQPGGVSIGNVFATWAEVLAAFNATKGPIDIAFDGSLSGGLCTVASCDMQARATWVPANASVGAEVVIPDGAVVRNLSFLTGNIQLDTASAIVSPMAWDDLPFAAFTANQGSAFLQRGAAPVMTVKAGQTLFVTLDEEVNVNSFNSFAELVDLPTNTSVLALSVFSGFNFFNASGRLVSGIVGSQAFYLYDASWPGNPANPNFFGTTGVPFVIDNADFVKYVPGQPSNWITPPADVAQALDEIASILAAPIEQNLGAGPIYSNATQLYTPILSIPVTIIAGERLSVSGTGAGTSTALNEVFYRIAVDGVKIADAGISPSPGLAMSTFAASAIVAGLAAGAHTVTLELRNTVPQTTTIDQAGVEGNCATLIVAPIP